MNHPTTSPMQCTLAAFRKEATALVDMAGSLRLHQTEQIRQSVAALMTEGTEKVYIYLGRLFDMDSAGLGMLVGLHMTARKKKIEMWLVSPTDYQMRLLEATKLTAVLNLVSGPQGEALRADLAREELRIALPELGAAPSRF